MASSSGRHIRTALRGGIFLEEGGALNMSSKRVMRPLIAAAVAVAAGVLGLVGFSGSATAQYQYYTGCYASYSYAYSYSSNSQNQDCHNEGDADGEIDQEGNASSGDGVAGQVAGVVSAGDASVDATNRSDDVDVSTGDASGTNTAAQLVHAGVAHAHGAGSYISYGACYSYYNYASYYATNATSQSCANEGDASGEVGQSADAASGDGVGGQVIGVVTSAGGSADLVLDNESSDAEVDSGDGDFTNDSTSEVHDVNFYVGP
jgi:hypothetical protein